MRQAFQDVADENRLTFDLKNDDRRFSFVEYFERIRNQFAPIAYWRLNEDTGSIAQDSSGNGFTGAITGATLNQPGIGDSFTSYSFDGVNDVVKLSEDFEVAMDTIIADGKFTIAVWVKVSDATVWTDNTSRVILRIFVDGNNQIRIARVPTDDTLQVRFEADNISKNINITTSTTDWFNITLTVDIIADEVIVYFNGVQESAALNGLGDFTGNLNTALIGSQTAGAAQVWDGNIAHVPIWDRVLTSDEIALLDSLHATRSALVLGRRAKVQAIHDGGTIDMWNGWIDDANPAPKVTRALSSSITGVGAKKFIQDQEILLPLMLDVTADQVITEILDTVQTPPLEGEWLLGIIGSGELGITTILGDSTLPSTLETGQITFSRVGDNWPDNIDAYTAIKSVTENERGKFFIDRGGTANFWNNQHWQLAISNETEIDETMQGMQYAFGSLTKNIVRVNYAPRVESDGGTLWQAPEDIVLTAGETKNLTGFFHDASENPIGGTLVDTSIVNSGDITLVAIEKARGVAIEVREDSGSVGGTITSLSASGTAISDTNKVLIERIDAEGIAKFGEREFSIEADLIDNDNNAITIADFELNRRTDLRGDAISITLMNKDDATIAEMINRTIGTRVRIIDTQVLLAKDYLIIGEQHTIGKGNKLHSVTWNLEPATTDMELWILEDAGSELGINTILGF